MKSAHGGHVDVYITVPEKPTEYALIRTKEDLGSPEKATKKESPKNNRSEERQERSFFEKKIHRIVQELNFFKVRTKSRFSRLFTRKKKK